MDRKWLPLGLVLGIAGAAVVTAGLWPGDEQPPLPESLCYGALSRQTAELIDDGGGGELSAEEWQRKGTSGDYAVFMGCQVRRAAPDGDALRGVYQLIVQDTRSAPGHRKDSVPLSAGVTGWALPDRAEAALPAGCAARMGSTAPYVTVSLSAPSQAEKRGLVDRDTAIRNSATVVREAAANLAEKYGC
ncbi:hypothetical protein RGF97_29325 [Streptomyces roseicoloratus]|uniref:Uncharacterized protein n=1 Tax=Streptomyces roseicoloratus TaxID=2508722 RepID=A0ABY9S3X2_9ACTN|nr:hypothetical protein [Streptomyces roseicoloratus]WMX48089.1 hypothetical protein RGF97_29325 [Streptomyces roseicoloratus]